MTTLRPHAARCMTRRHVDRAEAERMILELLARRDPGKTICPSDAARALSGDADFRPLMALIREAARALVKAGTIEVTQRGQPVDPGAVRGPVRLRAVSRRPVQPAQPSTDRARGW